MKHGLPQHILIDKSPGETRLAVLREGKFVSNLLGVQPFFAEVGGQDG